MPSRLIEHLVFVCLSLLSLWLGSPSLLQNTKPKHAIVRSVRATNVINTNSKMLRQSRERERENTKRTKKNLAVQNTMRS